MLMESENSVDAIGTANSSFVILNREQMHFHSLACIQIIKILLLDIPGYYLVYPTLLEYWQGCLELQQLVTFCNMVTSEKKPSGWSCSYLITLPSCSWDDVFKVSVGLYLVGTVVWNLFSTGEKILD
ncbi:hypothetical protein QQP08_026381 [Theobroma cacao]|nr:hypothetical protein QQP08_026381 [Theobroma cacao]